ncbi:hypothetical protein GQ457_10G025280 [Hibiscus cannabinus]
MNRVPLDAIRPRSICWCLDCSVAFPDSAVALESAAECDLPNPVAPFHPPLGLDVAHLVPERRGRCVAEPVQCHPRCLDVLRRELQVLLEFVYDCSAAGVDAKVFERLLEVGDVGFPFRVEDFTSDECEEEQELLGCWKDQGTDSCDVGF